MHKKGINKLGEILGAKLYGRALLMMSLRVAGVLALFLVTLYITNAFESYAVGRYEFARSTIFVMGSLILLGTDQTILFFAGRFKSQENYKALFQIYKRILLLIFVSSILLLTICYSIMPFFSERFAGSQDSIELVFKVILCVFFYAIAMLNIEFFRALDLQAKSEIYRGLFRHGLLFLGAICIVFGIIQEEVAEVFLGSYVVVALMTSIELFSFYRSKKVFEQSSPQITYKTLFNATLPVAISSLGFYLLISLDVFFLKLYEDYETLAFYGIALKIIFLIATIVNTVASFLAVDIANLFTTDRKALQEILKRGVRFIALLSTVLTLIILLIPHTLLSFFGEEYVEATNALILLAVGHFLGSLCGVTATYLNMTKKQKYLQNILIAAVILNALLNWILIPQFGIEGAAIASAASVLFWNVCGVYLAYRKDQIKLYLH